MKGLLFTMYWQYAGSQVFTLDTSIYNLIERFFYKQNIITHL